MIYCKPYKATISQFACFDNQHFAMLAVKQLLNGAPMLKMDEVQMNRLVTCVSCPLSAILPEVEQAVRAEMLRQYRQYVIQIEKWWTRETDEEIVAEKRRKYTREWTRKYYGYNAKEKFVEPKHKIDPAVYEICDEYQDEDMDCMKGNCPLAMICIKGTSGDDKDESYIPKLNAAAREWLNRKEED